MGEMTKHEIIDVLREDNPAAPEDQLHVYADAYLSYQEATANIEENGVIVAHPRTGAPIENPYLKPRARAFDTMKKCSRVRNVGRVWR